MFILKDDAQSLYIQMVRSDVAIDQSARGTIRVDAPARKLYVHAYSLPFWAAMETVVSTDCFDDLIEFTEHMDQIVVPQSMFEKLKNSYRHALQLAEEKDPTCVRQR